MRKPLDDGFVDDGFAREVEIAYRRGYVQGAYMAFFQERDGYSVDQLKAWRDSLEAWRFRLRFEKTPDPTKTTWPHWKCPPELFGKPKGGATC